MFINLQKNELLQPKRQNSYFTWRAFFNWLIALKLLTIVSAIEENDARQTDSESSLAEGSTTAKGRVREATL